MEDAFEGTGVEGVNCVGPSCITKTNVAEANRIVQQCRNPLELYPIIKCVFKYLDAADKINLRLVSKEWSSAGLGSLFIRSKIKLDSPEDMSHFLQLFSKTAHETMTYRKYTFRSTNGMWSVDELEEFFKKQGEHITELKFLGIRLMDNYSKQKLETWNINSWISNCALTKQILMNAQPKTKLSVNCEFAEDSSDMCVDVSALVGIKELTLKAITVNLQDGIRLGLTKLKLSNMTFMKGGHKLASVRLNDLLDISMLTCIRVEKDERSRHGNLSLELNRHDVLIIVCN